MTLKARLAAMMIFLLVAVMALQVLLTQREQRALMERLSAITGEIDATTREFSLSTLEFAAAGDSADVRTELRRLERLPFPADSADVQMMVIVSDDTLESVDGEIRRIARTLHAEATTSPAIERLLRRHHELRTLPAEVLALCAEIDSGDTSGNATWTVRHVSAADSTVQLVFRGEGGGELDEQPTGMAFRVHLPVTGADGAPGGKVELLYPASGIAEELSRARRRSWLWLAGLLGVGATGAVALAVQFTRPIRSLESSFAEVERGNLEVTVVPERADEVGRLTESFNGMVSKLRETRTIEARLAEAERLAAVGQLAAGVAHEVRNPLNAMRLTMAQLGEKSAPAAGTPQREQFDRYVHLVTAELERLERLVSTFLDLSRREGTVREIVSLGDALREGLALRSAEARDRGVTLTIDAPPRLEIRGDPGRLPVVWSNLVANALNAVGEGGTIRVTAREEEGTAVLEIHDDGPGIPPNVLPHVFEPFYSTRPDGAGLGLSLVRAIVEQHGGTVTAESEPGQGTCVRVVLPVGGGREDASTDTPARRGEDAGRDAPGGKGGSP